jgi:hypothetical protein
MNIEASRSAPQPRNAAENHQAILPPVWTQHTDRLSRPGCCETSHIVQAEAIRPATIYRSPVTAGVTAGVLPPATVTAPAACDRGREAGPALGRPDSEGAGSAEPVRSVNPTVGTRTTIRVGLGRPGPPGIRRPGWARAGREGRGRESRAESRPTGPGPHRSAGGHGWPGGRRSHRV